MKPLLSSVFAYDPVQFSTGRESVLRGGRDQFPRLHDAFRGVRQIGFIGWGSQGPAQAQNLRDTLKSIGSDIIVKIGLREGSKSVEKARLAGFTEEQGTLGEMFEVIRGSDIVILLISDGAQTELFPAIFAHMQPGKTLGLSHGFLLGHLASVGRTFPNDINIIMVAPKGMGPSVRKLYLQGAETDGAGINSSVAILQDIDGRAVDYALGWSIGIGSPATFFTTMRQEVVSDLFGERAMLLGGLWGLSEALYLHTVGTSAPEQAFLDSAKGLTSTVTKLVSELGLDGAAQEIAMLGFGDEFDDGYTAAYPVMRRIMLAIYDHVSSLREVKSVVVATAALKTNPMESIESSSMWRVAREAKLYDAEAPMTGNLAFAAGAYIAGIVAQMQILRENGHSISEVVNESLIEAIDSLNPYMDRRGVGYMVDNCSITARLGARKWGPVFAQELGQAFIRSKGKKDQTLLEAFVKNPIHGDIDKCYGFLPTVKISVD